MNESFEIVQKKVKESGMLFSQPMVKATLAGNKTVTRRIIEKQPDSHHWTMFDGYKLDYNLLDAQNGLFVQFYHSVSNPVSLFEKDTTSKFRYGKVGDYIYVKETYEEYAGVYKYKAENYPLFGEKWKASMFMPKAAARIWLKITDIKVERLNDITEEQCMKEGIIEFTKDNTISKYAPKDSWEWADMPRTPIEAYKKLWEEIQGKGSWDKNPWVWVIEFEIDKEKI